MINNQDITKWLRLEYGEQILHEKRRKRIRTKIVVLYYLIVSIMLLHKAIFGFIVDIEHVYIAVFDQIFVVMNILGAIMIFSDNYMYKRFDDIHYYITNVRIVWTSRNIVTIKAHEAYLSDITYIDSTKFPDLIGTVKIETLVGGKKKIYYLILDDHKEFVARVQRLVENDVQSSSLEHSF